MTFYLILILAILIFQYLFDLISDLINMKNLKKELPDEFQTVFDAEKYSQSQKYTLENTKFSLFQSSIILIILILFIILGGFNWVDQLARSFNQTPLITGLIFAGILMVGSLIVSTPFDIYQTFHLEAKYGFNKTTAKIFILDFIKSLILTALIGGAILLGILWFFQAAGALAWFYSWIAMLVFMGFMQFISPILIMPLFNKFTPLQEGELKEAVNHYAQKENFKIKGIFTMDGSKRSTKLNAFFTGFGKSKRIVFFDTLIEKISPREIISVLAHEMGHFKHRHLLKGLLISIITSGLMFFLLSFFINNPVVFEAFNMQSISIYASLAFFAFLYSPVNTLLGIFTNILSRKHEYQADRYAVTSTGDYVSLPEALKKLSVLNLSNLNPHPFYVFVHYSHPPVLERIRAIKKIGESQVEKG